MTSRLFISLDIPENEINRLSDLCNSIYGVPNDLRWEDESKMHITLKFLGDVGENIAELLLRRLEEVEFDKILASFNKFSFFKKNGSLKILFASLSENMKIKEFHKIIEEECELLGFEKESRKYHPHLTLLRIKGNEEDERLLKFNNYQIEKTEFSINSFSVIKSKLLRTGSEYTILKRFNLL